jgi:hypothetical protein
MTTVVQSPRLRVTFNGATVSALSARTSHGVDQPIATATIDIPLSALDSIPTNADVVVLASLDGGSSWLDPLFTGRYRTPDRSASVSGNLATLLCEGRAYRASYPLNEDIAFTGGAKATPDNLQTAALHVGNDTISWYADSSPNGTTVNLTETPAVDASFVWVAGRLHGTNSYPTSLEDRKIKQWSRIELWQDGAKLGYANFPENSERYNEEDPTDFDDDENWADFELFITAAIVAADGDLTFKLISGTKPGSGLRDEYEVKNVTWQTAGTNTVREIIRGLLAETGLSTNQYSVKNITDLDGNTMRLGGNGLVDAGQVIIRATESPLSFITRVAELFGYRVFDCPDGVIRCVPVRGAPTGSSSATFVDGTNIVSIRRWVDARNVANAVRVDGASGTDQDRKRFAYASQTADEDVEPSDLIPDPPGVSLLRISDSLLTSNSLCGDVRRIAEINHAEAAVNLEWQTWPVALRPGQIVTVTSPSANYDGKVWLMSIEHDLSVNGFRTRMTGWAGGSETFDGDSSLTDPNPSETPILPGTPRPTDEWFAYKPKGVYSNG